MIVLGIGAIFVVSLAFFIFMVFGKIENENRGISEETRSEIIAPGNQRNKNYLQSGEYQAREKEVVLK